MKTHITTEVTHYKGQCYHWDVVNEALNTDGSFRSNIFYETIGSAYINIAFETAAAADPDAKLYYNDYGIEYAGAKATAAKKLVSDLLAAGVPIDGVGLQGHFEVGDTPDATDLASEMKDYVDLGVEVAYTEVDVRFTSLPPSESGLAQQSSDYASIVTACVNTDGCVGVTVWDFDDAVSYSLTDGSTYADFTWQYSWVPSTFSGEGEACLYDSDLAKKPAYAGVVAVLS
jgi:endo-1,4-beta-xylanase